MRRIHAGYECCNFSMGYKSINLSELFRENTFFNSLPFSFRNTNGGFTKSNPPDPGSAKSRGKPPVMYRGAASLTYCARACIFSGCYSGEYTITHVKTRPVYIFFRGRMNEWNSPVIILGFFGRNTPELTYRTSSIEKNAVGLVFSRCAMIRGTSTRLTRESIIFTLPRDPVASMEVMP